MRVLFTTQPGEGHFTPLVPLAQALLAAGHEVVVACAPSFCPVVAARGLRAVPMGLDYTLGKFSERWPALRDVPRGQGLTFIMAHIYAGDLAAHALP
ncbi:MAG TPA: hypothetical protein VFU72_02735, partial [Nitrolancea sp.]|nr:hypothetical protein [Nitrolancea sp.]